jgi:hypothetical protein
VAAADAADATALETLWRLAATAAATQVCLLVVEEADVFLVITTCSFPHAPDPSIITLRWIAAAAAAVTPASVMVFVCIFTGYVEHNLLIPHHFGFIAVAAATAATAAIIRRLAAFVCVATMFDPLVPLQDGLWVQRRL